MALLLAALVVTVVFGAAAIGELGAAASPAPTPTAAPTLMAALGSATPASAAPSSVPPSPAPPAPLTSAPPPQPSAATPAASPSPARVPVDRTIVSAHTAKAIFASEETDTMCASAAVQMAVELLTGTTDTSLVFQTRIRARIAAATTRVDSHDGLAGPVGMATVIADLSGVQYELRTAVTRLAALRDAAATLSRTGKPIILFVWWGAHAWVMTGYRGDADPLVVGNAKISGTYILDAWYPRISTIWGRSDPPGTFQDSAEMIRNYLPWARPEGHYPGRDGLFLYLAPVEG